MQLKQLGEFALIDRIRRRRSPGHGRQIIVDLGDDAFAARLSPGCALVSTKDMLVEDVHFRRDWTSPFDLGYKSMAVNISDLAAMGKCRPLYALIGIGLPGDTTVDFVDKLYTGMNAISAKYGISIVGGDTVASKKYIVISITLIGEAKRKDILTRSGAKAGDSLFVTGTFGDSAGGLFLLMKGVVRGKGFERHLLRKHRLPEPRLREAHRLTATGLLTGMIDSSDGLAASAQFIAASSGVGIRIDLEKLPVSRPLRQLARAFKGVDPVQLALTGGEDYELVFSAPSNAYSRLRRICPGITPVGEITKDRGVRYYSHGHAQKISTAGYRHFE